MKVRRLASRRAAAALPASGVFIVFAVACSSGAASDAGTHSRATRSASDPPLLVPWRRVGEIWLGEPQARVEREYGSPGHGYHVQTRITWVAGLLRTSRQRRSRRVQRRPRRTDRL